MLGPTPNYIRISGSGTQASVVSSKDPLDILMDSQRCGPKAPTFHSLTSYDRRPIILSSHSPLGQKS